MLRMSLPVLAATLVVGAFGVGLSAPYAYAATPPASNLTLGTVAEPSLKVAYVKKKVVVKRKGHRVVKKTFVYSRAKYGARFRYRHGPYRYYYGGYYYTRPW